MVTPNPVGFRLAEAERFGPSAGDQISPCGVRLVFFRDGVGLERRSRQGGGD